MWGQTCLLLLGLRILAFPCNQFAGQEPGNSEEIACSLAERRVKFDLFEKVDVNGNNASPLWKFLKVKRFLFHYYLDLLGGSIEQRGPPRSALL